MSITIKSIDHFVLTVADIDATCHFYQTVLGMQVITFGEGRKALSFGSQKINLHSAQQPLLPHAHRPTKGSADFCLITEQSVSEVIDHLKHCNVVVEEGPVKRTGALGPIESVYFRDPDNNLIEVSTY